jgi:ABC-type multidrug transport system, permease component
MTTTTVAAPRRLGRAGSFLRDIGLVFGREIRPELRTPIGLIAGMTQPLVFLALFGPLLSGMPGIGESPWQWFVPGNLVMIGVFGTSGAGYHVLVESGGGSLERVLVTPLNRAAMLIGRTLKEAVTLLAQGVLIILAVLPFGFRLHPAGAAAGLALLAVTGIGIGSLSFALALAAKRTPSLFWGVQQTVLFPLLLLSGVLLPADQGPAWLATASRVNPLTYVVEAERALFNGDLTAPAVGYGLLAAAAIAAVGLAAGIRGMRRAAL